MLKGEDWSDQGYLSDQDDAGQDPEEENGEGGDQSEDEAEQFIDETVAKFLKEIFHQAVQDEFTDDEENNRIREDGAGVEIGSAEDREEEGRGEEGSLSYLDKETQAAQVNISQVDGNAENSSDDSDIYYEDSDYDWDPSTEARKRSVAGRTKYEKESSDSSSSEEGSPAPVQRSKRIRTVEPVSSSKEDSNGGSLKEEVDGGDKEEVVDGGNKEEEVDGGDKEEEVDGGDKEEVGGGDKEKAVDGEVEDGREEEVKLTPPTSEDEMPRAQTTRQKIGRKKKTKFFDSDLTSEESDQEAPAAVKEKSTSGEKKVDEAEPVPEVTLKEKFDEGEKGKDQAEKRSFQGPGDVEKELDPKLLTVDRKGRPVYKIPPNGTFYQFLASNKTNPSTIRTHMEHNSVVRKLENQKTKKVPLMEGHIVDQGAGKNMIALFN